MLMTWAYNNECLFFSLWMHSDIKAVLAPPVMPRPTWKDEWKWFL
jgi:hypothetical protein